MGSLTTLAGGTIRARLPASLDPKRRAKEFPPGHTSEAVAWLDGYLNETLNNNQHNRTTTAPVTLGEWAGTWHETYVAPILAPNTARHYLYLLQQLAPLYGTPLADLRPSMLQAIVGSFSQRAKPATIHQAIGVWRACLEAAVDDELLARNPVRRVTAPKAPPRAPQRHLTPREAQIVSAAIVGHRFEAAYSLLLGTGLRIGEVLGLSWTAIDLAGRRAWIQRQWTDSRWREVPKGKVARWIDLPPSVVAALIRHRNSQEPGALLVFQSPFRRKRTGEVQPWSAFVVRSDLHALVAELNLDALTPHAARRGLSSALLNGGIPAADVARVLGHSSPDITLRSYSMPSGNEQTVRRAVDDYLGAPGDDVGTDRSDKVDLSG